MLKVTSSSFDPNPVVGSIKISQCGEPFLADPLCCRSGLGTADAIRSIRTAGVHLTARRRVVAWPLAARAEQHERIRRIEILMPFAPTDMEVQALVRAFRVELRKRG